MAEAVGPDVPSQFETFTSDQTLLSELFLRVRDNPRLVQIGMDVYASHPDVAVGSLLRHLRDVPARAAVDAASDNAPTEPALSSVVDMFESVTEESLDTGLAAAVLVGASGLQDETLNRQRRHRSAASRIRRILSYLNEQPDEDLSLTG